MCHWQYKFWNAETNGANRRVYTSASNGFLKRGVTPGDTIYVISQHEGRLYLGGRMTVNRIVSRREAIALFGNKNLYDATEFAIGSERDGTILRYDRVLALDLTKCLRFLTREGERGASFVSRTRLDNQALRGIRELTSQTAALLDEVLELTDDLTSTDEATVVSEQFLEGAKRTVVVNRYERDRAARTKCLAVHGTKCCVCTFDFGAVFGPEGEGCIHVHHLTPLSEIGEAYVVDSVRDLRPVCPNCHAMIHMGGRTRTIDEVRELLRKNAQPK